jgi:predicted NAD-dependent protein-ADP-ribosyltransferase YbiA (DUF1768 family)
MRMLLKPDILVLIPESPEEVAELSAWKAGREGYVAALRTECGAGVNFNVLGPREDVCRDPMNVTSRHADPKVALISNFAATPFELDGRSYASVESFWQGLKFPEMQRAEIATWDGRLAKRAGEATPYGASISYQGEIIPVGTWKHWQLMERACRAKFTLNFKAQAALLSTGDRPLMHRVRRDSRTIPGVIMADIWMRIRHQLQQRHVEHPESLPDESGDA